MHYCSIFLALAYLDVQASIKDVLVVECRDAAQIFAFVLIYMAQLVASGCQFGVFSCFAACLNTRFGDDTVNFFLFCFVSWYLCALCVHEARFVQRLLF